MRNLKLITFVSIPLSPIAELFERYVFGDWGICQVPYDTDLSGYRVGISEALLGT